VKRFASLVICLAVASCSSDTRNAAVLPRDLPESTVAFSPAQVAVRSTGPSDCPHTGKWALCSVENRLRQSGFVARRVPGQSLKRPGFSVAPVAYSLGRGRLEVFIYADSAAMARDMEKIDTLTVAPRAVASPWEGTPVLIRSGNLAAVLLTDNSRQIERLSLALTAGAPQPGSPR
jgi:hypothetical protein